MLPIELRHDLAARTRPETFFHSACSGPDVNVIAALAFGREGMKHASH
jgi:hypothetical protein